ncbi:MAG TPA: hypothetical protein PKE31_20360 [Pseudomonadota bacterium]|jgi:electron transfer flavoprotein alpha/beta subunit|nr:hypothetical protein [Pseudomonadota bacterium]
MKVLVLVSPLCGRAVKLAASLGDVYALALAETDAVFSGVPLPDSARRVRVWDKMFQDDALHPFDGEARAAVVVAQVARHVGASTVLLTESTAGYLGAAVAEQLNLALVSDVISAQLEGRSDPELVVSRRGLRHVQTLRGGVQAVLSVLPPLTESTQTIEVENGAPSTVLSLEDLSLSAADLPAPTLRTQNAPQRHHQPRLFLGAELLVERLRRDGLE